MNVFCYVNYHSPLLPWLLLIFMYGAFIRLFIHSRYHVLWEAPLKVYSWTGERTGIICKCGSRPDRSTCRAQGEPRGRAPSSRRQPGKVPAGAPGAPALSPLLTAECSRLFPRSGFRSCPLTSHARSSAPLQCPAPGFSCHLFDSLC